MELGETGRFQLFRVSGGWGATPLSYVHRALHESVVSEGLCLLVSTGRQAKKQKLQQEQKFNSRVKWLVILLLIVAAAVLYYFFFSQIDTSNSSASKQNTPPSQQKNRNTPKEQPEEGKKHKKNQGNKPGGKSSGKPADGKAAGGKAAGGKAAGGKAAGGKAAGGKAAGGKAAGGKAAGGKAAGGKAAGGKEEIKSKGKNGGRSKEEVREKKGSASDPLKNIDKLKNRVLRQPIAAGDIDRPYILDLITADNLLVDENYSEALESFNAILKLFPQSPRAQFGKGITLSYMAEIKKSNKLMDTAINFFRMAALESAVAVDAVRVPALVAMADKAQLRGDIKLAIRGMEKLVGLKPKNEMYSNQLGALYLTEGNMKKAKAHFKKCVKKFEGNHFASSQLGSILFAEKRYEEALPLLMEGIRQDADLKVDGRFYNYAGEALTRLNRSEEVRVHFVYVVLSVMLHTHYPPGSGGASTHLHGVSTCWGCWGLR